MKITVLGVKFQVEFSFLVFAAMLFLIKDGDVIRKFLAVCLIHELGHAVVLILTGGHLAEIIFSGMGIKMIPEKSLISIKRETAILLAGPLVNLGIFFLDASNIFCIMNLFASLFNLLPYSFLDGGSILNLIFGIKLHGNLVMTIIRAIPVLLSAVLVFKFGSGYISIMCVMLFYFVSDIISS